MQVAAQLVEEAVSHVRGKTSVGAAEREDEREKQRGKNNGDAALFPAVALNQAGQFALPSEEHSVSVSPSTYPPDQVLGALFVHRC
jgi:hypothetical protein